MNCRPVPDPEAHRPHGLLLSRQLWQIMLNFTGSTNAVSYNIERSPDGLSGWAQATACRVTGSWLLDRHHGGNDWLINTAT